MRASANLSIKGTKYYKAAELFQRGALSPGVTIRLEHQPDNLHDKNAVAVKIKRTGAMLGHISREIAPKYAALINEGKIIEASIAKATMNGTYIKIDIRVLYEQPDEHISQKHNSHLWISVSKIPAEAGIYAIQNIKSGRQYIGSSINLKDRIHSHIRELSIGCHANHALQSDFLHGGENNFEVKVLATGMSPENLASAETDWISTLLHSGSALYNLTPDGQGIGRKPHTYKNSEPVSDRIAKQLAAAKKQQTDETILNKRKAVIDTFEKKVEAIFPQVNFWVYFVAAFICIIIVLIILIPKINGASLFVISGILAFIASLLTSNYFQEKAKQSRQYQDLIKQRDEQLNAIYNEYK